MRCDKHAVKYTFIIYWSEEDKTFIAEVPELPGCMNDGKTLAGAHKAAEEIAKLWVDTAHSLGRPIPVPRGRLKYA